MKAELTDISACKKSFDIEIPEDVANSEVLKITQKIARSAKIPGFRPGRAPLTVVRTRYHSEIVTEVLQHLLPHYFADAVQEKGLHVVDAPEYDSVEFDFGQPVKFKAAFEVYPELSITNYKGIPVEQPSVEITDADVTTALEKLRDERSELTPVEGRAVLAGDFVEISFTGTETDGAEPLFTDKATVEVGGESTLKEFTENLTGASPNDEKTFAVTYREDYPEQRLAGKAVNFTVKVEGIKEKKTPELNDEFAQEIGDYKTLDDLRNKIREDMEKHRKEHAGEELREKLLEWLEQNNEFEVPDTLVAHQTEVRIRRLLRNLDRQGINPQRLDVDWTKIQEDQKQQAVRDVKGSLILDHVALEEKVVVTDDEVEAEIDRIAEQMKQAREKVKQVLGDEGGVARLRGQIQNKKTLDFLQEHARIQAAVANG